MTNLISAWGTMGSHPSMPPPLPCIGQSLVPLKEKSLRVNNIKEGRIV